MNTSANCPMWKALLTLPEQFRAGRRAADVLQGHSEEIQRVVVCGMGGSSFPADFLNLALAKQGRSVSVVRDYTTPIDHSASSTLVVAASFSGNTEETITAYEAALSDGAQVVALTTGGRLAELAEQMSRPLVRLERPWEGFQPRAATGLFIGALAGILHRTGFADGLDALIDQLTAFCADEADVQAQAQALRDTVKGTIPVIYATAPLAHTAARVCKIKLNENAKIPAFYNEFPELNHNELEGFRGASAPFSAICLRDPSAHGAMRRRIDATVETLDEAGVRVHSIVLKGGNDLEMALYAARIFDYASCLLAYDAGIDPNPVELIEAFKRRLVPGA